jgi:hypothetical protein
VTGQEHILFQQLTVQKGKTAYEFRPQHCFSFTNVCSDIKTEGKVSNLQRWYRVRYARGKTTDEGTVAIMVSESEKYTYVNVMTEVYTGLSTRMVVDEVGRAVPDGEYPLCEDGGAFLMLDILITKMVEVILMFNILFMKTVELFLVQNTLFTKIIEILPNTAFPFHKKISEMIMTLDCSRQCRIQE